MILPASYTSVLILLILGLLGWGLWANTLKATQGKWRFELYCFDFALGLVLASVVSALTMGSLGFDGFSFLDDLQLAGKRQDVFAAFGGVVFCLGNMLLIAGTTLGGMSLAFPVAMGFGLVMSACWSFVLTPGGNAAFLFGGAAAALVAVVFSVMAYKSWSDGRLKERAAETDAAANPAKKTKKRKTSLKCVGLSLGGGFLIGSYAPLLQMSRASENGLGPYTACVMFALGVAFSTFVFNLFFMNIPVQGGVVEIREYFRAKVSTHGPGIFGGILWYLGILANQIYAGLVANPIPGKAGGMVSPQIAYDLAQGSMVLAALCGLFLWKERRGGSQDVTVRVGLMLALLVIGVGLSSFGLPPAK